jgi:hypothetical protein
VFSGVSEGTCVDLLLLVAAFRISGDWKAKLSRGFLNLLRGHRTFDVAHLLADVIVTLARCEGVKAIRHTTIDWPSNHGLPT